MKSGSKKDGLSREQVAELYGDVRKAMSQLKSAKGTSGLLTADNIKGGSGGAKMDSNTAKQIAMAIRQAMARDDAKAAAGGGSAAATRGASASAASSEQIIAPSRATSTRSSAKAERTAPPLSAIPSAMLSSVAPQARGPIMALGMVMMLGALKLAIGGLELMGILDATPAIAAMQMQAAAPSNRAFVASGVAGGYSKEEARILQALDARRVELNERAKKLDDREAELSVRDREFTVRTAQLKDLSDKLRVDRERGEKRRDAQVEQLANVYSSMGPQEAAQLLEQLDVTIALPLIERMPEKKIGQILALMSRERALMLTKMLSAVN